MTVIERVDHLEKDVVEGLDVRFRRACLHGGVSLLSRRSCAGSFGRSQVFSRPTGPLSTVRDALPANSTKGTAMMAVARGVFWMIVAAGFLAVLFYTSVAVWFAVLVVLLLVAIYVRLGERLR